jgi:hypothetical protein
LGAVDRRSRGGRLCIDVVTRPERGNRLKTLRAMVTISSTRTALAAFMTRIPADRIVVIGRLAGWIRPFGAAFQILSFKMLQPAPKSGR